MDRTARLREDRKLLLQFVCSSCDKVLLPDGARSLDQVNLDEVDARAVLDSVMSNRPAIDLRGAPLKHQAGRIRCSGPAPPNGAANSSVPPVTTTIAEVGRMDFRYATPQLVTRNSSLTGDAIECATDVYGHLMKPMPRQTGHVLGSYSMPTPDSNQVPTMAGTQGLPLLNPSPRPSMEDRLSIHVDPAARTSVDSDKGGVRRTVSTTSLREGGQQSSGVFSVKGEDRRSTSAEVPGPAGKGSQPPSQSPDTITEPSVEFPHRVDWMYAHHPSLHLGDLRSVAYEQLLMSLRFLSNSSEDVVSELLDVMRPALGISSTHHKNMVKRLSGEISGQVCSEVRGAAVTQFYARTPLQLTNVQSATVGLLGRSTALLDHIARANEDDEEFRGRQKRFVQSIRAITSGADSDEPQYPQLVYCWLYSALLYPVYIDDYSMAVDEADIENLLQDARAAYGITRNQHCAANVLGLLLARAPHFVDLNGQPREPTVEFATMLMKLVQQLPPLHTLGSAEGAFQRNVLHHVLSTLAPTIKNFTSISDRKLFAALTSTFLAAVRSSSTSLLKDHFSNLVHLATGKDVDTFIEALLYDLFSSVVDYELSTVEATVLIKMPTEQVTEKIIALYDISAPYVNVLEQSLPHARMYPIPGIVLGVSKTLQMLYYKKKRDLASLSDANEVKRGTEELRRTALTTSMQLFEACDRIISLRENPVSPTIPPTPAVPLSSAYLQAVGSLGWMMAEVYDVVLNEVIFDLREMAEGMMMHVCWFASEMKQGPDPCAVDLFAIFFQKLSPLNLFCSDPQQYVERYCDAVMDMVASVAIRIVAQLRISEKIADKRFTSSSWYIKDWEINKYKSQRMRSFFTQLDLAEVVLRLNTLISLAAQLPKFGAAVDEKVESLQRVAGGSQYQVAAALQRTSMRIAEFVTEICEFIALRLVYYDLRGSLHQDLYRVDIKYYKTNKTNKKLRAADPNGHILQATNVTMATVLDELDRALATVLPHVISVEFREVIVSMTYYHMLYAIFTLIVDGGEDRIFFPARSQQVFEDVCVVENFFGNAGGPPAQAAKAFASTLKCIASMVMDQESTALVNGGDRCPPFQQLPAECGSSPFSQFIVHMILGHRKDEVAKQFMKKHPMKQYSQA